jgi:hypothetical protein
MTSVSVVIPLSQVHPFPWGSRSMAGNIAAREPRGGDGRDAMLLVLTASSPRSGTPERRRVALLDLVVVAPLLAAPIGKVCT